MQPNYCVQKTTDSKLVLLYVQLKQTVKFIADHCVYNTALLDAITNRPFITEILMKMKEKKTLFVLYTQMYGHTKLLTLVLSWFDSKHMTILPGLLLRCKLCKHRAN